LPTAPDHWNAVFSLATVEPDGSVLLETWVRDTVRPTDEPRSIRVRLRCPSG
jgi:hypothetical protein